MEFSPAQYRELLIKMAGAIGDAEVKEIFKAAVLAKAGMPHAERLTPDEIIRDLFIDRERNLIPTPGEIGIGRPAAASGEGAEGMVRDYSKFAPQPQMLTHQYDKFEEELGSLRAYMKSTFDELRAAVEGTAKAVAQMAKAEDEEEEDDKKEEHEKAAKAEEEHEDEEEMEDHEKSAAFKAMVREIVKSLAQKAEDEEEEEEHEEEEGKSLSAAFKARLAHAILKAVKQFMGSELPKSQRTHAKAVAEAALKRAAKAAHEAEEEKEDKESEKAARKALQAIEEYAFVKGFSLKAKKMEKMDEKGNQHEWPAEEHAKSLEGMVAQLTSLQTDVKGLFDTIAGKSKSASPLEVVEPLAKAMESPNFFAEKARFIDEAERNRRIDANTAMSAMEVLNTLKMAKEGQIPQNIPTSMLANSSAKVKALFKDMGE